MLKRYRAWRRRRALTCYIDEEWTGQFIGIHYCSTHDIWFDPPPPTCPMKED